jgi:hypothetical protein
MLASQSRKTEPRLLRPSAAVRGGPDATRSLPSPPFSRGRLLEAKLKPDARSWREPRFPAQRRCVPQQARTASLSQRLQEEPVAFCTVWVRPVNSPDTQFSAVKDVDCRQSVDDFKVRWLAQAKRDVDPSLASLYLVPCGSRKPTAEEEKGAVLLDDPRLSLAAAGVTDGCSLLAFIAGVSAASFASPQPANSAVGVVSVSDDFAKGLAAALPSKLSSPADVRRVLSETLPSPVLVDASHAALLSAAQARFYVTLRPPGT